MLDRDDDEEEEGEVGREGDKGGGKEGEKEAKVRLLLSTCPQGEAEALASFLVESRLAACVNIVPVVTSVYRWEGKLQKEPESLLVIKCPKGTAKAAMKALVERHTYDVPEVIVLAVKGGHPEYLNWVVTSVL